MVCNLLLILSLLAAVLELVRPVLRAAKLDVSFFGIY